MNNDDTAGNTALNGDLAQWVVVATEGMEWQASPGGHVQRKRVHRVGPAESGQVTSVVRYLPGATFPSHEHPEGEEILVLEGVFSDEQGDWPAGSYLLNPEGFSHAPFSTAGCTLFVKLRQYPGRDRIQQQIQTADLPWLADRQAGREYKLLYQQPGFSDSMRLERWLPATEAITLDWPDGAELFVLEGSFTDQLGHHRVGTWLRLPPGSQQRVSPETAVTVYTKQGGFPYLRSP
ncbi:MAG: cupin domain-containing protein [Halieaceae bacterium]|jgi:anti-sigma factor ChrR (cupin superfamily)|nr:cupin domain-containing protein [Halieaceae bacterium]